MLRRLLARFRRKAKPHPLDYQPGWDAVGYRCMASHIINAPSSRRLRRARSKG